MTIKWPPGFKRVPNEEWTTKPVDPLPLSYEAVKHHGWYRNLEPTLEQVSRQVKDGEFLLDYSGGTGIFTERLLERIPTRQFGAVIVDSSPKFLRLALEKLRDDERVAFRTIQYLKDKKRLQFVDEVLALSFDALVSTNAIHLYYDLQGTLQSWFRVLKPGASIFVQSGNIRNPGAKLGEWIIDETVGAIHQEAIKLVLEDNKYSQYRPVLQNSKKMEEYAALRKQYFLEARPIDYYLQELGNAGFRELAASSKTIEVNVGEWLEFLSVYHDGILGWVGGVEKVENRSPSPSSIKDRLTLMREAMEKVFAGKSTFVASWSYITGKVPA